MFDEPFFIPAVLILILAIPLILGLIPQNRIYGVRTPENMANKEFWYRANRYGGWALLFSSIFYLFVAGMLPSTIAGNNEFGRWAVHLAAFVLPIVLSLLLILGLQSPQIVGYIVQSQFQ